VDGQVENIMPLAAHRMGSGLCGGVRHIVNILIQLQENNPNILKGFRYGEAAKPDVNAEKKV